MTPISRHLVLVGSVALLAFAATSCDRSENTDKPEVWELRILQPYVDGAEHDPLSKPRATLHDILQQVWRASDDENVRGLLVRVGPLGGAWGSVGDLSQALNGFRSNERPIHCHFETADNVAYMLLAGSCDRISMSPAGVLDLIGPAAVMIYARAFLDKIGVQAEILHMGRYKGAGDMFIRNDMPPEAKESMDAILDDFYGSLIDATASRTDGDAHKAKALIDAGPFVSSAASKAGLVDSIGFLSEAREEIKKAAVVDTVRRVRMIPQQDKLTVRELLELFSGDHDEPKPGGERIALVFVTGNIVESETLSLGDAASGPFVRVMERLAEDANVKAVVLRINSPGGSALASDRMWEAARRLSEVKPLIASVGDMAASGGYYIASAADEILAHPDSIVGSIGVVGGKFNFGGLATELGVNTFVLQRGKHAAWSTPVRGLTPSERGAFEAMLRDTYDRFIARVAEGREMERSEVLAAAEGRVLTAQDAEPLGLVDGMAGLGDALAQARERGGLGPDSEVEIWPGPRGILDAINDMFGENGGDEVRLLSELGLRNYPDITLPVERWRDALLVLSEEHVALIPPFVFSVR